jgi:nitrogen fixation/metabolism regulation signal transduction histidine kinase
MRLQSLVVAFLVVVIGGFVLLNQGVVMEPRSVQLPGARVTVPILGIALLVAVSVVIGMLLIRLVEGFSLDRAQRRLRQRLAQREHEIALLKGAAYDNVAALVEGIHREVSTWIAGEARRQENLESRLAALHRVVQARVLSEADREPEVPRVVAEREAA